MTVRLEITNGLPNYAAVGKPPLVANPASGKDPAQTSINLLSGLFQLQDSEGGSSWVPKLPSLKGGGNWNDPAQADGRFLLSDVAENVVETMSCVITHSDIMTRHEALRELQLYARNARRFFTSGGYQGPVYLTFQAKDTTRPQYALIHNIDIDVDMDMFGAAAGATLTLSIERESYWRAIPPGENPKVYTFEKRGMEPHPTLNTPDFYSYAALAFTSQASPFNSAFNQPLSTYNYSGVQSFIDIHPQNIPGDAPALALLTFSFYSGTNGLISRLLFARSTARDYVSPDITATPTGATISPQSNSFNAADMTAVGATKVASGTEGILAYTGGQYFGRHAVTGAPTLGGTALGRWSRLVSQFPHRYAVFVRARVPGTVLPPNYLFSLTAEFGGGGSGTGAVTTTPVRIAQGNFGMTYLGVLDLTAISNNLIGGYGLGVDVNTPFTLTLNGRQMDSGTYNVEFWDVMLMPIDEQFAILNSTEQNLAPGYLAMVDSTNYFTKGRPADAAIQYLFPGGHTVPRELKGVAITLRPGIRNRIYIMADRNIPMGTFAGSPTGEYGVVYVDIVPRWNGIREDQI